MAEKNQPLFWQQMQEYNSLRLRTTLPINEINMNGESSIWILLIF